MGKSDRVDRGQVCLSGRNVAPLRQAERDRGLRPGIHNAGTGADQGELERENRELRQAQSPPGVRRRRIPAQADPDLLTEIMIRFIYDHRALYGVEPICRVLPIAPSTITRMRRAGPTRDPRRREPGATPPCGGRQNQARLQAETSRCTAPPSRGASRCAKAFRSHAATVERLMEETRPAGCARGRNTLAPRRDPAAPCPLGLRKPASPGRLDPNALWVSDFTYVSTWQELCLCRVHHRCVCPLHRWLARVGSPTRARHFVPFHKPCAVTTQTRASQRCSGQTHR